MIKIIEVDNALGGNPFYMAQATKMKARATGVNKRMALKNLKYVIAKKIKEK